MITIVFLAACAAALVLIALQIPKWRQQWRNARGVIELTEHEAAQRCDACGDPTGMAWCVCPVFCGHRLCRERRTQARWNTDDMDVLAGDLTSLEKEGNW